MKHTKKKRRSNPPPKQGAVKSAPNWDCVDDKERLILTNLTEAFTSVSLQEAASAYKEADGDPNKAAEILGNLAAEEESLITTYSSSTSSCVESSSSSGSGEKFGGVRGGGSKPKKVIAATGMVSTVLGKDYVSTKSRKGGSKCNWSTDNLANNEDAAQFLCSMMGDECDLSMAVVRDVLCQCGYNVEKGLNILLELSDCSGVSNSNPDLNFTGNRKEDTQMFVESSENFIDRASDSTSHSSESELQDNMCSTSYNGRNHFEVLTGSREQPSSGPRNSASELPQLVLESLFNTPKSYERAPNSMNWRNVVKKMESFGQRLEFSPSEDEEEQQYDPAKGDDYQVFRETARQHWDSMKSYYQKAASAFTNGEREYAAYLSEQGRVCNKLARQADEKASQDIFKSRNKSIENMITIDLHGQHVKQAMRMLKLHLIFGAYVRSVRLFRVITGCGSHGVGKSKLKQSVVDLIEKEGIEWSEENRGTLLIKLAGQTEFSFLDSESDDN